MPETSNYRGSISLISSDFRKNFPTLGPIRYNLQLLMHVHTYSTYSILRIHQVPANNRSRAQSTFRQAGLLSPFVPGKFSGIDQSLHSMKLRVQLTWILGSSNRRNPGVGDSHSRLSQPDADAQLRFGLKSVSGELRSPTLDGLAVGAETLARCCWVSAAIAHRNIHQR